MSMASNFNIGPIEAWAKSQFDIGVSSGKKDTLDIVLEILQEVEDGTASVADAMKEIRAL